MPRSLKIQVLVLVLLLQACSSLATAQGGLETRADVRSFIQQMSRKHQFNRSELSELFHRVKVQYKILDAIARPAEAKPWHAYRRLFLTDARIQGGIAFWRQNREALAAAERKYGVPAEMIIAIIGIETSYGRNRGNYRVIDALSTLAFEYPKRSGFFRRELEEFLLLCREEGIDPSMPVGSYAGAMGMPQFMPSSFRHYAADLDGDSRRDIWNNAADAIASVANYFAVHGWRRGEPVIHGARVKGDAFLPLLDGSLKPTQEVAELIRFGVEPDAPIPTRTKANLLLLEEEDGPGYWLSLHNFYVISRYNHSPLYAMAAYELSQEIRGRHQARASAQP
jgi:membrane-bound lytic murein transglycosylase B